ncbi:MAG TPA: hypothetical protein VMW50_01065 [Dehalococcoidia bacterium]|nr:hypothetical protein [Dehalococcoidia bacterium]
MSTSNNPYRKGDKVRIERGAGWLHGIVVKTILARVHILIDGNVFVEDWHDVKKGARKI